MNPKPIEFLGTSRDDLRAFPRAARTKMGFQLHLVEQGEEPTDWKPMSSIGPGAREIRLRESGGALRVIHVATLADAVRVLDAFEKRTEAPEKRDPESAAKRFGELWAGRR